MAITAPVTIIRSVGGLIFDATFEEEHTSELEATENPVETGNTVADNAYMKPLTFNLQAGVTNTPLRTIPNDQFSSASAARIQAAFDLFKALQASAEPFSIQTGLLLYQNMLCMKINVVQNASTANALVFKANFREVILVSTQTVSYPNRAIKNSAPKKQKGEKQATQITDENKKGSILSKFMTLFGGSSTPGSGSGK